MDLLSLPQKMLANILKYKSYDDIHKFRTLSSYIDSTVKLHTDLKRIPVERLVITRDREDSTIWNLVLHLHSEPVLCLLLTKKAFEFVSNIESITEKIFRIGKKVLFTYGVYLKSFELGQMMYSIVESNKTAFKKCKNLDLLRSTITLSIEDMKKFIDMLPEMNTIQVHSCDSENYNSEVLLNVEVLKGRKWENIYFERVGENVIYPHFDDAFLMNVVVNCQFFHIFCYKPKTFFTFDGVINMIKETSSRFLQSDTIDIGPVELANTRLSEIETILKSMPEIYEFENNEQNDENIYTVCLGARQSTIIFSVPLLTENE